MIDVNDASLTCESVDRFPLEMYGGFGGLLAGNVPIACFGYGDSSYANLCYILDKESGFHLRS